MATETGSHMVEFDDQKDQAIESNQIMGAGSFVLKHWLLRGTTGCCTAGGYPGKQGHPNVTIKLKELQAKHLQDSGWPLERVPPTNIYLL